MSMSRLTPPVVAALMVLTALVVYAPGLGGGFVFDDVPLLVASDCHHGFGNLPRWFDFSSGDVCTLRPLRYVTFALDFTIWGQDPFGYHLTNALLHGLVAFLVWRLLARLTGNGALALGGALLFVVHPVATEAVAYVSGRRDLMMTAFSLLVVDGWLAERAAPRPWRPPLLALGLLAALLCHEAAAGVAGVLVGIEACLPGGVARRRRLAVLGLLLALVGAFALWSVTLRNTSQHHELWGGSLAAHVATVLHGHLHYLGLLVLPLALQADYSADGFPIASGFGEPGPALALVVLVGATAAFFALRRRAPLVALALFAYGALLLPSSQVVPHHELMAEHRLYVVLPIYTALVAAGLQALARRLERPRLPLAVGGLLGLALLARTELRLPDWRDEEALWTSALDVAPRVARAHANLGAIRAEQGRRDEAYAHLTVAVTVRPDLCPAWFNRGLLVPGAAGADDLTRAWACDPKPRWRAPVARALASVCRLDEASAVAGARVAAPPTCAAARP